MFCRIFVPRIALPVIPVELMAEQYAAVKQQQQQAYECFLTRVLPECRWVLLPLLLSARVPVTAWPRRARGCLSCSLRLSNRVIVAPCPFFAVQ